MANENDKFPKEFPFWARLRICKNRPTLIIDETKVVDKKTKKIVPGYVHREATHSKIKGSKPIEPNPDPKDKSPMYLKAPRKTPRKLFKPINKN